MNGPSYVHGKSILSQHYQQGLMRRSSDQHVASPVLCHAVNSNKLEPAVATRYALTSEAITIRSQRVSRVTSMHEMGDIGTSGNRSAIATGAHFLASNSPKHFVALDLYRFVASFGVFVLHFTEFAHYSVGVGFGKAVVDFAKFVDFFFILSGFVIGLTSFNQVETPSQIFTFLRRRIARIYPMHILTLTIFLVPAILGLSSNADKLDPSLILKESLLVRYWQPHAQLVFNFPSWSISVEWAMYLCFPIFALLYRKIGWGALAAISMVAFAAMEYNLCFEPRYHGMWFLMNVPLRALPTFTIGIILSQSYGRWPIRHGVWMGVATFAIAILSMVCRVNTYIELALFALSIWLTAAGYAFGENTVFDRHRVFRWLGDASYSLYMLHVIFLIVFVQKLWPLFSSGNPPLSYGVLIGSAATLLSIACYHLFEKPAREWISNRKTTRAVLAGY